VGATGPVRPRVPSSPACASYAGPRSWRGAWSGASRGRSGPLSLPGRTGRWWEHGPVGPGLEFALGRDGCFGGGEAGTRLNEGTHLTASIHFFGAHPEIVAWVGVVSDEVARLEVRLDDGGGRAVELH
jgi:hypothetical protein